MPVVKYRMDCVITEAPNSRRSHEVPSYIEDGGYFYRAADQNYIGWVSANTAREWKVPDSLIPYATKAALQTYVRDTIHVETPFKDINQVVLTNAEVDTMVSDWWMAREV